MKKIINGKLYNTETAQEVSSYSTNDSWRDFSHVEETLYKKRTGEYFLFGEGGPASKYARRVESNSWSSGSAIIPLSYDDAKQWAEDHMDADDYMKEFGPVTEDDSRVSLNLSLPVSIVETIRREAKQKGISVSEYVASKF